MNPVRKAAGYVVLGAEYVLAAATAVGLLLISCEAIKQECLKRK